MAYVIGLPCVDIKDRSCVDECPVDCIYEGRRALYIHPEECVDCGACEPVCPVDAIYFADDLPEEWGDDHAASNADFFATLGSPGGGSAAGPQDHDSPLVSTLPKKVSA
ncbi:MULTISPECIES: ferredoxin [unclassified Streptomyces]|uniref:ferredoxin n=1 Tax=unclassified Streptomyces TaxID=2593676 RepID=UPI000DBA9E95|nr:MULTISPECIES: ferredoxin [Streptomyces]MYU05077.1 ferredoxin [Streptomyces sp. SID8366]MYU62046.1 ferredoxin [Streptomyces sp. SID69]RAJ65951.1 NAD-dependent dihydropyrimidine dehydrogenase PreA subunit [Streptomyces sp. PsTaAH-130]TXJ74557.1 ferredoxin family protein [Streptomyces lavendulae]